MDKNVFRYTLRIMYIRKPFNNGKLQYMNSLYDQYIL